MKKTFKIVKWILFVCAGLFLLTFLVSYFYLKSTVSDYDGELKVKGIESEVEIVRDDFGMPHVFAKNDKDAAFGLGYCMAQDRMFQMEMQRRLVRGQLAEVLGEKLVERDKYFRTITAVKPVEELYQELPAEIQVITEAFAAGVNAFLEDPDTTLPIEFFMLGYKPKPWVPSDSVVAHYFMSWGLSFSIGIELVNAAIVDKVGPKMAKEIMIDFPDGYPTITSQDQLEQNDVRLAFLEVDRSARQLIGLAGIGGSNSWVVSGKKSASGKPLLANDMHLGHSLPGIWYEARLQTPNVNVSGVFIPGIPFVVVGANQHVAWGFTNTMADDTDFYYEKQNPDNPNQVEFQGAYEDIRVKKELIKVKDKENLPIEIRLTRHGPIINDIFEKRLSGGKLLSLRWLAAEVGVSAGALYAAGRAKNVTELEKALISFKIPGQNWVYADSQGNIGYWAAVGIPIRKGFTGSLPLEGWSGKYEWQGLVPSEEQPHFRNPEKGWIATANNKIVDDDYAYLISNNYALPDRITRINRMIEQKDKLTIDDFKKMHADIYMLSAEEWVPKIMEATGSQSLDEQQSKALQKLKDWDYVATAESQATCIFHAFIKELVEELFQKRLGDDLYAEYIKGKNMYAVMNAMRSLINSGQSAWFDNPDTSVVEGMPEVISQAFKNACGLLNELLGTDVEKWAWGKLHTLTFYHPIGRISKFLGNYLNVGPFPLGGSFSTVNPGSYFFDNLWEVRAGASMRYIFDFSDMKNSLRVIPSGISGNFMSPHYDDQVDLWLNVKYRPFVLSGEIAKNNKKYFTKLVP
jgi:penicillin amidase